MVCIRHLEPLKILSVLFVDVDLPIHNLQANVLYRQDVPVLRNVHMLHLMDPKSRDRNTLAIIVAEILAGNNIEQCQLHHKEHKRFLVVSSYIFACNELKHIT